jgi:hypothetical protein
VKKIKNKMKLSVNVKIIIMVFYLKINIIVIFAKIQYQENVKKNINLENVNVNLMNMIILKNCMIFNVKQKMKDYVKLLILRGVFFILMNNNRKIKDNLDAKLISLNLFAYGKIQMMILSLMKAL